MAIFILHFLLAQDQVLWYTIIFLTMLCSAIQCSAFLHTRHLCLLQKYICTMYLTLAQLTSTLLHIIFQAATFSSLNIILPFRYVLLWLNVYSLSFYYSLLVNLIVCFWEIHATYTPLYLLYIIYLGKIQTMVIGRPGRYNPFAVFSGVHLIKITSEYKKRCHIA